MDTEQTQEVETTKKNKKSLKDYAPIALLILIFLIAANFLYQGNYFDNSPKMSIGAKKKIFNNLVTPAVKSVYAELNTRFLSIKKTVDAGKSTKQIEALMVEYEADNAQELLSKIKPHALSVTLAQAAMASGWGTSRLTKVANNLFGIHSENSKEPRVETSRSGTFAKKYPNIEGSLKDYYKMMAKSRFYKEFREEKMRSNDPYALVKKLSRFSNKDADYAKNLAAIIKYNRFDRFDK
jgi:Bax protein